MSFIELLGTSHGTLIYHLLVIPALGAMALISLIEWRHTRNLDHRSIVWAFVGLLVSRVLLLLGELLGPAVIAPLINGMEAAGLALLGWAFLASVLGRLVRQLYLPCGIGVAFLAAVAFLPVWYRALEQSPGLVYGTFWQQPVWHALSVLLTLIPAVILLRRQQRGEHWMPILGFGILGLGCVILLVSSLIWIGAGRLINLLGYSFLAVAVYRTTLQDMWAYRQELQTMSEEALRQTKELFFLAEASRTIGESLNLNVILHHIVESIAMALDADRAAIFLIGSDKPDAVTLVAQYTLLRRPEEQAAQPFLLLADQPTLNYALQLRKQLILNSEADNPRLRTLYELLGSQQAGPTIVQPLLRQDRILGALVVGNDHSGRTFGLDDGRLCQSIAVQVAGAVENARLYRDLQAQAGQLAELLQSQEDEVRRRTAILESIAEGVIVGDREGNIAIVNAAVEDILGAPRQRLLGRSLEHLTGHTVLDQRADWGLIAHSNAPLQTVFELENKVVHVSSAPVLTPAGDNLGVVAVLRDITRETDAEQTKSEFITAVSHELRTPLTAIKGYAEALGSGMAGAVSESQTHFLRIIRDNAVRMVSLAENLIALSKFARGEGKLEYGETDLPLIIGDIVSVYQSEIEARQLEVSLELDDDLPLIEADSARVRQILDNLINNAIKFTYPGGHVTVGAKLLCEEEKQAQEHCTIWVSDTGIGISPEEQGRVWERFYRPSNPLAVEASGLGVGLSIVKSLVEAHGGRAWLESTPGAGSTFTVLLPVKRAQPIGDQQAPVVGQLVDLP